MSIMNLELPLFTMASQMNITYATTAATCTYFYTTTLLITNTTVVTNLCADPSNTFNFVQNTTDNQDYIKTSIALMSVYFYGSNFNTANANYYSTFKELTGWTDSEVMQNFRVPGTGMASFASTVQTAVYN